MWSCSRRISRSGAEDHREIGINGVRSRQTANAPVCRERDEPDTNTLKGSDQFPDDLLAEVGLGQRLRCQGVRTILSSFVGAQNEE